MWTCWTVCFFAKSLNRVIQRQLLIDRDELCVNAFKQKCKPQVTACKYDNFSRWHQWSHDELPEQALP